MTEAEATTLTEIDTANEPDDDVKRLSAFTDAVMAIAMTLLVLDLDKPNPREILTTAQLHEALGQWSAYVSYALSFWVIGMYWQAHFRSFRRCRHVDGTVIKLTLLFLFGITFLPFPTAILQRFSDERIAVLLYSGTLAAVGYSWSVLWYYSVRKGHLVLRPEDGSFRDRLNKALIPPSVFLVSFGVAWIDPQVALWLWLALPAIGLMHRFLHKRTSPG